MRFTMRSWRIFVCGLLLATGLAGPHAARAEVLFQDDFESGALDRWFLWQPERIAIVEAPGFPGSRVLRIRYEVPDGPPAHQDDNESVQVSMHTHDLHSFFVRGRFYVATPPRLPAGYMGRKLFYIFGYPHYAADFNDGNQSWAVIVGVPNMAVGVDVWSTDGTDNFDTVWELAPIVFDRWYAIEVGVRLNTPGLADGELRLWLDGALIFERTGIRFRDNLKPLGRVMVGDQINRAGNEVGYSEERYWDDIAIANSGPIGPGDTLAPAAPTNLSVQ
ncbi:MAG TPA: hypothetical protein VJ437_10420 [Acidiferrobacterales bacterium]|nr:hypothetical protein [Acidiferrobacterales bacterium]